MGAKGFDFDIRSKKQLNRRIDCLRYTLTSLTVTSGIIAIVILAYCIWMKVDPKFYEWLDQLDLPVLYAGIYVILVGALIVIVSSFVRCMFILSDNSLGLKAMIVIDVLVYLFCVIGSAVLLNYSTLYSPIQDKIKDSILELIARPTNSRGYEVLQSIQESMACCGANGANDYVNTRHAVLPQCRDAVSGSAYLYGCTEKLTTFLGEKSGWLAGIAMLVCSLSVLEGVMTIILIKLLRMEVAPARYK